MLKSLRRGVFKRILHDAYMGFEETFSALENTLENEEAFIMSHTGAKKSTVDITVLQFVLSENTFGAGI